MMLRTWRPALFFSVFSVCLCASAWAASATLPAYVDLQRGIIVGGGEAVRAKDESYDEARLFAVRTAKDNIAKVLGRQPADPESAESKTLDDYLSANPGRKIYLDSFLDSAQVYKEVETGEGKVEVTLILPVEGPNGFKSMLARITGKSVADVEKRGPVAVSGGGEELSAGSGAAEMTKPYKILVLPFENQSDYGGQDIGPVFADRVERLFKRDRHFVFITGEEADRILDENGTSAERIRNSDVNRKHVITGIDGLVFGTVTLFKPDLNKHGIGVGGYMNIAFDIEVELRVLDAGTGRWLFFDLVKTRVEDRAFTIRSPEDADKFVSISDLDNEKGLAARTLLAEAGRIEKIVRGYFPVEGYVLKVVENRVYISLTKADDIKAGDEMNVYRLGEVLEDPVTGAPIDRIKDRIGAVRAADVKDTYTQCTTSETPLVPIKPGDVVKIK